MAQATIWLQGGENIEETITGWSSDWNKIYIDHMVKLSDTIPVGSTINSIEFSTDASSNVGITAGYIRIDIFDLQGKSLYYSPAPYMYTSWETFDSSNFGGNLAPNIKVDEFKIRLNCKGTERKWWFRNSKLVIDYTPPTKKNIFVGTNKINEIYIGTTPVKEVYVGTKQIY